MVLFGCDDHTGSLAMGGTTFLSSYSDGTLKLWDAATGKLIRKIKRFGACRSMAKIDETRIVTRSNKLCRVYDVESEYCVKEIKHLSDVRCVAVSPDGTYFLTGCWDGIVRKWNSATYEKIGEYEGVQCDIIAFLDDERFLSSRYKKGRNKTL